MITIHITLLAIQFLSFSIIIRNQIVSEFRRKWIARLDGSPESLQMFISQIPSYQAMVFSFKRLTDENWIPLEVRAAASFAVLSPTDRNKLLKYLSGNDNLKQGEKLEAFKNLLKS